MQRNTATTKKRVAPSRLLALLGIAAALVAVFCALPPQNHWKVIAHRGYNAEVAENTTAAINEAYKHSFDGVEIDVRRTGDGAAVLSHEPTVKAWDDAKDELDIPISQSTRSELLSVILDRNQCYGELHLATLDEALALARQKEIEVVLHLKEPDRTFAKQCANLVVANGLAGRCMYNTNGDIELARAILEVDDEAKFHVSIDTMKEQGEKWSNLLSQNRIIATMSISEADSEDMQIVKEQGWTLYIWDVTTETEQDAERLEPEYIEYSSGELPAD